MTNNNQNKNAFFEEITREVIAQAEQQIKNLIKERMSRQNEAVFEVSSKHAGQQSITGPVLTIPFDKVRQLKKEDGTYKFVKDRHYFHILPEDLTIEGSIKPERRKRGIFEVVVYGSKLNVKGSFDNYNFSDHGLSTENLLLDKAFVTIGITDLKGVRDQVKIKINDSTIMCNPGVISNDLVSSGLHIRYPLSELPGNLEFNFDLSLNGSESIMFTPIGKVTNVNLSSQWVDPSFGGSFLPKKRKIDKSGFEANWKVLHLNRNYPQSWVDSQHRPSESRFGVNLKLPVDVYQKSMRVAKYAILFIVLTYLVFFFVEILNKILIHPIQYILVGIALVLFYVLMLAFSEQMYFDLAYALAAFMTISLVLFYCRSILKSWALAGMTATILAILYSFIFIIIQMQDLALLFGSLGVFLILGVTMYFSRKIDWFNLVEPEKKE